MSKIPYNDIIKNKLLKDFHECEDFKRKTVEELACPSCGFMDQEPEYSHTCSECGHIR